MTERRAASLSSRKQPRQARSAELVAAVLEGAAQVLAEGGARRFTTGRVAERAGVSVGSLYQYFPNKAAILFRLQHDEWRRTTDMLARTLGDTARHPEERLRDLVQAFVRSERDEAALRGALDDAAPFYRDAPEAEAARAAGGHAIAAFVQDWLPEAPEDVRAQAADLLGATLGMVGKHAAEQADLTASADALADMLSAYLELLRGRHGRDRPLRRPRPAG